MVTFEAMKRYVGSPTAGRAKKDHSDLIMENTWDRDIQSCTVYLYDYYHDDQPAENRNLNSPESKVKIPIDAKYIVNAYQSDAKDQVSYHLQFKPFQECNVDYYEEVFHKRYKAEFPLGLFCDVPDEKGRYNRWLITERANTYNPQFVDWSILPCDYRFQWIFQDEKYQMWGVLRSQNSYNSGVWRDYRITSIEDQQKFVVPLNRDSEKLFYNQRMIIDAPVLTEPRAWKISKVNRISPNGLTRITLAQDRFDQHRDYIELDDDGDVIGMWADYYLSTVPTDHDENPPQEETCIITYSGVKPELKVGGSYKTLTSTYYDADGNVEDKDVYEWKFKLNGEDICGVITDGNITQYTNAESQFITIDEFGFDLNGVRVIEVKTPDMDSSLNLNQIKVKFIATDDYYGSVLTVYNDLDSLDIGIVGL